MPALHYSSFEAGEGLRIPMPDPDAEDRALYGFIQQAEQVAVGANAIIERAVMEGLSTVVEGVHLVPGLVAPERHHAAVVVQVVLAITDEDAHQAHFLLRDYESGGSRAMERYLRAVRRDPADPGLPGRPGRAHGRAGDRGGRSERRARRGHRPDSGARRGP